MYPHERSLVKAMESKPFVLLGVNSDQSKDELKKVIEDEKMTWRSWYDGGTSGPISTKFNVHGWPTLYLIDADGVIRHKFLGNPGDKVMDDFIDALVKKAEGKATEK